MTIRTIKIIRLGGKKTAKALFLRLQNVALLLKLLLKKCL